MGSTRTRRDDGTPGASSSAALARMLRQPTRDTGPEIALRRRLHALGLRYRIDVRPLASLRRRADIVFARPRVAVFVDGCFWHRCPACKPPPKSNGEWWRRKLQRTWDRDRETDRLLREAGWVVVRVWEHEDVADAAARIAAEVERRRSP